VCALGALPRIPASSCQMQMVLHVALKKECRRVQRADIGEGLTPDRARRLAVDAGAQLRTGV